MGMRVKPLRSTGPTTTGTTGTRFTSTGSSRPAWPHACACGWFSGASPAATYSTSVPPPARSCTRPPARGLPPAGVEPTPSFAAFACETANVDVTEAALEEVALEREALDVVTLWHVLEHLADPVAQLIRIRSSVRSVGLLALEVPNYASAVARHLGTDWPHLDPDVHLSQFTPNAGYGVAPVGFRGHRTLDCPDHPLPHTSRQTSRTAAPRGSGQGRGVAVSDTPHEPSERARVAQGPGAPGVRQRLARPRSAANGLRRA